MVMIVGAVSRVLARAPEAKGEHHSTMVAYSCALSIDSRFSRRTFMGVDVEVVELLVDEEELLEELGAHRNLSNGRAIEVVEPVDVSLSIHAPLPRLLSLSLACRD